MLRQVWQQRSCFSSLPVPDHGNAKGVGCEHEIPAAGDDGFSILYGSFVSDDWVQPYSTPNGSDLAPA